MAFNLLDNRVELNSCIADMAELADALRSGRSGGNPVQVRLLLSALLNFGSFHYDALTLLYQRLGHFLFHSNDT